MKKIIGLILIVLTIGVFIMNYEKETEVAVISTKYGDMVVEFYPDVAPMHVESFVALTNEKYFDATTFHRVIPDFVIQGGDPNSKLENRSLHGTGGRAGKFFGIGDDIAPELVKNGIGPEIVAIRIEERLRETKLDGSLPWQCLGPRWRVGGVFDSPFRWHRKLDRLGSL